MRFRAGTSCSITITLAPVSSLTMALPSMVTVSVTAENDLDVRELEAELCHAGGDLRDGCFVVGVDQDVTFGRGDEIATQVRSADEVDVADDLVGRERFIPVDRLRRRCHARYQREGGPIRDPHSGSAYRTQ